MQQVTATTRDARGRFVRSGGCCNDGMPIRQRRRNAGWNYGFQYQYGPTMTNAVDDGCFISFGQLFQQQIVDAGYGKTPFLPDDVIATLDLPKIERYAQVRCGRQRNISQCAGAYLMIDMIQALDNARRNNSLYVGWTDDLGQPVDINPIAAAAVYGLCREKIYRGMRAEMPGYDAGEICIPEPVEGVMNDPLYQQALAMTPFRCGNNQPIMTYQIAKFLAIAKGRGREMSAAEVAKLRKPPPMTTAVPMPVGRMPMYGNAMDAIVPRSPLYGGGRRYPVKLGGGVTKTVVKKAAKSAGGKNKKKAAKKPTKKTAKAKRMY